MPVVAHPGPSSPAPPALRLEVPDSWVAAPAGDALLRVAGPGSAGGEVVVEVRHRVEAAGTSAEVLVAALAAEAAGSSGEVEEAFVVEVGGREWSAHNVSRDGSGGDVVEVHLVAVLAAGEEAVTAVHVRGRVAGEGLDADYDALQQVLETVTVAGSDSGSGDGAGA
ncbi:hypothetical protein [Arthrobacter sp. NEB 688]|uniref:hypothetical protein n=1 Tax=Arthrobacter sp. NEB 688 TaxID=904039 RepID=UPI001563A3FE|nr:hypothetical protein [Arthrobacter sp. NEB 688]QKE83207.1 hypothetical protein HL663_04120 [Arthrobacter sp. NEB 688]